MGFHCAVGREVEYVVSMDAMTPDEVTRRVLERYDSAEMITVCAWCRRTPLGAEWPLVPRVALVAIDEHNSLTHGVCPSCLARLT
jgi:hypothetical protein